MRGPSHSERERLDREAAREQRERERSGIRLHDPRIPRPRDPRLPRAYAFLGPRHRAGTRRVLSEQEAQLFIDEVGRALERLREWVTRFVEERRRGLPFDDLFGDVLNTLSHAFAERITSAVYSATRRAVLGQFDERPLYE